MQPCVSNQLDAKCQHTAMHNNRLNKTKTKTKLKYSKQNAQKSRLTFKNTEPSAPAYICLLFIQYTKPIVGIPYAGSLHLLIDSFRETKVQAVGTTNVNTESNQLVVAIGAPNKQLWNGALKCVVSNKSTLR